MKNVSFMQLILGVAGGMLIYAGIKDINLGQFFYILVRDPSQAFSGSLLYQGGGANKPAVNTTPNTATKPSTGGQSV